VILKVGNNRRGYIRETFNVNRMKEGDKDIGYEMAIDASGFLA
jgi:hypothetical protein